jgi:hypothetical protein
MLQLRIVQAVLHQSRQQGLLNPELRQRAADLVEKTAVEIEPEAASKTDADWLALLESVRGSVAED